MKWAIYNLLFAAVYPLLLPGFLLRMWRRGGYAAHMGDRFALYGERRLGFAGADGKKPIWIHAVSVGEVQVAGQLMREWRKVEPEVRFCFSTTSSTGWKMAEKEITDRDTLIYNPLDFPNFVKSAFKAIAPRAIVLTESEIWPNMLLRAKREGIPTFLINARISDRSAPRYRRASWFFKELFESFTKIFAQSELDAERILSKGNVEVTGSFKFDVACRNVAKERELREWIGEGRVLLGGSTWPGEDKVLIDIYQELKARQGDIRLVIAPRHFEKADAIEANIRAAGFSCRRRSRGDKDGEILLCDTTGEMMGLFGVADIVFVGKSLCEHGSQNMIEPCLCGKPTLVGPYTENFRPVMSDLKASEAIIQVKDAGELRERIVELANDARRGAELGARAQAAVEKRRGVVEKCVRAIRGSLAVLLVALMFGCSKTEEAVKDDYIFAPITNVCRMIERLENPLFLTNAVFAKLIDVRGMSARDFQRELAAMEGKEVHLWIPGQHRWLLIGHATTNQVSLARAMDAIAFDRGGESLPELFANYVGKREDILPAFQSELRGEVVPEWFLTKEIPQLDWLNAAGIDADILKATMSEIRSMQVVRRLVLEGNMLSQKAKDAKDEDAAIDKWSRAAKRNPRDLLILERLDRLERNAKGFLEVGKVLQAMKCYETMVLIKPTAASVNNFGMCLMKIGRRDMAEQVLKRAREMSE